MKFFSDLLRTWMRGHKKQQAADLYDELRQASLDTGGKGWVIDPTNPDKLFVAGTPMTFSQVWAYSFDELEESYKRLKQQLKAAYPDFVPTKSMLLEVEAHYAGKLMADTDLRAWLKPQGFATVQYLSTDIEMDGDVVVLHIIRGCCDEVYRFFVYDHPESPDHVGFEPGIGVWCRPERNKQAV